MTPQSGVASRRGSVTIVHASVTITARGEERLRRGHPWIYKADVVRADAAAGDPVTIVGPRARHLGTALYSDRSQIALRVLTRGDHIVNSDVWRERLNRAIAFRDRLGIDASAYRLIHAEADLLPALIVDRYDRWLVVQALAQGVDRLLPEITGMLVERLRPEGILARNDPRVRLLEGLERTVTVLHGEVPDVVSVQENGVRFETSLRHGQKTGLFLDQRENRGAAAAYARGRVLDCFSYNGGFALTLAPRAQDVIAIDSSADAVGRIRHNAAVNGTSNVTAHEGNVFDELRQFERAGERFDTIVLDPPAFAKNKASVPKAIAGYKEINLRALRLLNPGGTLVTCSCSYNIDEALFLRIVHEAAVDARCAVTLLEKRMQGRDHPVLIGVPETYYLKCLILRKIEP